MHSSPRVNVQTSVKQLREHLAASFDAVEAKLSQGFGEAEEARAATNARLSSVVQDVLGMTIRLSALSEMSKKLVRGISQVSGDGFDQKLYEGFHRWMEVAGMQIFQSGVLRRIDSIEELLGRIAADSTSRESIEVTVHAQTARQMVSRRSARSETLDFEPGRAGGKRRGRDEDADSGDDVPAPKRVALGGDADDQKVPLSEQDRRKTSRRSKIKVPPSKIVN
ncbi:hypothetical protein ESCO_006175 [Escovopsis weberi]|uniref:Uncharacterized protein n=1 Tax=Escovopsis weberi TaxID=150374 RepID=A0A0M9VUV5_ESCWE|nr:hypothetical protein ESCO_006175 [Escovopsis weberi]